MSSCPVRAADENSQAASMDAAGSDDALGYPGVDRNGVAGPRFVVAGEHVAGIAKTTVVSAAGNTAFATVHMEQHFMQP